MGAASPLEPVLGRGLIALFQLFWLEMGAGQMMSLESLILDAIISLQPGLGVFSI